MTDLCLEDALGRIEQRLALLAYVCECAGTADPDGPAPDVWHGLKDVCAVGRDLARRVRHALPEPALSTPLASRRR